MARIASLIVNIAESNSDSLADKELMTQAIQVLDQVFVGQLLVEASQNPFNPKQWQFIFADTVTAFLYYRLLTLLLNPLSIQGGLSLAKADDDVHFYQTALHYSNQALEQVTAFEAGDLLYNANFFEDMITNALLTAWARLRQLRSPLQANLAFLYEMHLPLYLEGKVSPIDWQIEELSEFFYLKANHPLVGESLAKVKLNLQAAKTTQWLDIYHDVDKEAFYLTGLYRKGFSTAIAKMTGMTRQNIDYHLQSGQVAGERHQAAAVVMQLNREQAALLL